MNMVAMPPQVEIDRLGALVWYTIRLATRPTLDEIQVALSTTSLPSGLAPGTIAPSDALRRAIKGLGTLPERTDDEGHVIRLLMREAVQGDKDRLYLPAHSRDGGRAAGRPRL